MSWKTSKLGDVCEIIKRGIAPKYVKDGGICVVNQKCVRNHTVNYELARRHDTETKKVSHERFLKIGDVLVNSTGTGTLGRVAQIRSIPPEPTTVDTHVTIVRMKPSLFHKDFFGYMLIKIEEEISVAGEGASGQTELPRSKLQNDFSVSYPQSIPEQKRIVAILDRAFSDIDRARELTEKNIQNARELFESYLQRIFSETGEGWTELVLKECVDTSCTLSYGIVQPGDDVPGGLPIVRPTDLTQKVITAENLKRIDPERASSYSRTSLRGGELLLCVRGTTGTVSKASEELDGANVTRGIVPIRFDQTLIDQDFGYYLLVSKAIQGQVAEKTYGTALMQINIRDLKELKCPVPPKYIQPGLLANLMRAEGAVQHLESIYLKKLAALEELKKSLLQKAFSGELTAGEKIPVEEAAA